MILFYLRGAGKRVSALPACSYGILDLVGFLVLPAAESGALDDYDYARDERGMAVEGEGERPPYLREGMWR